jgi:hypothetical protein
MKNPPILSRPQLTKSNIALTLKIATMTIVTIAIPFLLAYFTAKEK